MGERDYGKHDWSPGVPTDEVLPLGASYREGEMPALNRIKLAPLEPSYLHPPSFWQGFLAGWSAAIAFGAPSPTKGFYGEPDATNAWSGLAWDWARVGGDLHAAASRLEGRSSREEGR